MQVAIGILFCCALVALAADTFRTVWRNLSRPAFRAGSRVVPPARRAREQAMAQILSRLSKRGV